MLEQLGDSARIIHIVFGTVALIAFWVPVFARKGAALHTKAGKVFVWSAYVVLAAAALALLGRVAALLAAGLGPADRPALFGFIVFLGYLTLVTYVIVRQGMGVLRHKQHPAALRTPLNLALAFTAIGASAGIILYALLLAPPNRVLLFALSPLGFVTGAGNLRFMHLARPSTRAWFYEHMGAMLGAGIAFHTAFAVFGMSRLFDLRLDNWVGVIPWVLPAIVGVPATAIWTRHYRRKFGDLA